MVMQRGQQWEEFWAKRLNTWHTLSHSGLLASPIISLAMNWSGFIYSIYKMAPFIEVNHLR